MTKPSSVSFMAGFSVTAQMIQQATTNQSSVAKNAFSPLEPRRLYRAAPPSAKCAPRLEYEVDVPGEQGREQEAEHESAAVALPLLCGELLQHPLDAGRVVRV